MQTNVQSMATVQSGSGERTKHLRNLIDRRIKRGGFLWQACRNINVPAVAGQLNLTAQFRK